jgi:hypothetical protein
MASYGLLRRVAFVRTDVSEELSTSFIRVTIMGELGTMLAVTSNRREWFLMSLIFPAALDSVDCSVSNRNEYHKHEQKFSWRIERGRCLKLLTSVPSVNRFLDNAWSLLEPYRYPRRFLNFIFRRKNRVTLLSLQPQNLEALFKQTNKQTKQTPWPLVRERTIPTDWPPLVDEI